MCISDFSYKDLVVLASSLSIVISNELNSTDIITLATFFTVLGDNLALLSLNNDDS